MANDAKIIISAVDNIQAAVRSVSAGLQRVEGLAASADLSLGALGAGLTFGAAIASLKATTDALDKLNDAADATGASVESLSKIENIARRNGQSLETVETAVIRLNKQLNNAEPGSVFANGMNKIGLSVEKLKALDPAEAFIALSRAIGKYVNDGDKARFILDATGRTIKEIAPLMKDISEAGELQATVTTAQAQAAEEFNKKLFAMRTNVGDVARSLVGEMLPSLNALSARIAGVIASVGGLDKAFTALVFGAGRRSLTELSEDLAREQKVLSAQEAGFGGQSGPNRAAEFTRNRIAGINLAIAAGKELQKQEALAGAARLGDTAGERRFNIDPTKSLGAITATPRAPRAASTREEVSAYDALIKSIKEKIAVQQLDSATDGKLSEGQRQAAAIMSQLRDGTLKLVAAKGLSVDAQKRSIAASLEELIAEEKLNTEKARAKKLSDDLIAAGEAATKSLDDEILKQKEHNETIGLTAEQQARLVASKQDLAAATDDELASNLRLAAQYAGPLKDAYLQYADELTRAAQKKRELANLQRDGAAAQAEADYLRQQAEEWRRFTDQIEQSLTDSIVRAFDAGGDAGKVFIDTIKNYFKTAVIRVGVQAVVSTVSGGTSNVLGAASTSGGSSLGGLVSDVSSLYQMFGGNSSTLSGLLNGTVSQESVKAFQAGTWGQGIDGAWGGTTGEAIASGLGALGGALSAYTFGQKYGAAGGFAAGAGSIAAGGAISGAVSGTGAIAGAYGALAAIPVYGWIALAVAAVFGAMSGKGGGPKQEGSFDSKNIERFFTDSRGDPQAKDFVAALQDSYTALAVKLGGKADETLRLAFGYALDPIGDAPNALHLAVGKSEFIQDRGRPEDFQAQASDALNRGLLEALKQTDLYDAIDAMLDAFDPFAATSEQVTAELDAIDKAFQAIQAQGKNYRETLAGIADVMQNTQNMFAESIRNIKFGNLDAAGKYGMLDAEAARYRDVLKTLTDPTLVQEYAKKLNDTLNAAYGLLDANEQARLQQEYITRFSAASALTEERLAAAADIQKLAFAALPRDIAKAIEEAMQKAVSAIQQAVSKGVAVDIRAPAGYEVALIG